MAKTPAKKTPVKTPAKGDTKTQAAKKPMKGGGKGC
jgi:hypothetical protein